LSGIPARAGSASDEPVRGRTTAPCLLPRASRAPAARCAGWLRRERQAELDHDCRRRGRERRRVLVFDGRGQSTTSRRGAAAAQTSRRAHAGQRPKQLRSRPTSTRNRARYDHRRASPGMRATSASRDVSRPCFAQRAGEREQHRRSQARSPCDRDARHGGVHDQRLRRQQRSTSSSTRTVPPRAMSAAGAFRTSDALNLRQPGCLAARSVFRPGERSACRLGMEASHRDPCDHELVMVRRGRERRGVAGERALGLVDAPGRAGAGSPGTACAALARSPCASRSPGRRRAPSPASPGARGERDFGLATTHARATASRTEGARALQ
jgi:hypothetical protein